MINNKIEGLVESINRSFDRALSKDKIHLAGIFEVREAAVTGLDSIEYHMQLRDMFHDVVIVSSVYTVTIHEASVYSETVVRESQKRFYDMLIEYMMFAVSVKYTNLAGIEVSIMSLKDILEDITRQYKEGFTYVNTEWLHRSKYIEESKKRIENGNI